MSGLLVEFNRLQPANGIAVQYGARASRRNTATFAATRISTKGSTLYRKYRDRGLVVLGFPSNDFGAQEPGSNQEIAEFCRLTYGVQFPMFEKASVTSLKTNPLYADLAARTGQSPRWNFHKYLIDRNGNPAGTFASDIEPDSRQLVALLEKLLADKPASQKG